MGRTTISLLALLISGQASAVGLGELRGQPVLGEALRLEVTLIGADQQRIDASCFRLLAPAAGDDLPWLQKAAFAVRKAKEYTHAGIVGRLSSTAPFDAVWHGQK